MARTSQRFFREQTCSNASSSLGLSVAALMWAPTHNALAQQSSQQPRVLVFSKTAGFRHSSIEPGIAAIKKLGRENGFICRRDGRRDRVHHENLKRYRAVVLLSTTGDVLDAAQQDDFERYIQAGGGYVGIHSATDTEYEWPWYGKLAGAYFNGHPNNPNVRKGTFRVVDKSDPSTQGLPERWERTDEFYNFRSSSRTCTSLVDIDEKSYEGGTNGDHHPMSWYHEFSGGRAWYTNMGHTERVVLGAALPSPPHGRIPLRDRKGDARLQALAPRGEPLHEGHLRRKAGRAGGAGGAA